MVRFTVMIIIALFAFVSCKSVHKREIDRDTTFEAVGPKVKPEEAHLYRYQVAVGTNCGQHCGGTIISDRLILTAAHCVFDINPRELTVKAGITNVDDDKNAQIGEVFDFIVHRNYVLPVNDIALLLLQEPLDLKNLTVAKLAEEGDKFLDEVVEFSGWGTSKIDLTHGYATVKDGDGVCEHNSRLCAWPFPGMDITSGDSGGPAVIRRGNEVILIGVARGLSEGYQTYSNVANLRPWIDDAIENAMRTAKVADRVIEKLPKHRCYRG